VTEFPELQTALVDAAGRRYARRRAWRPVGGLILVGAAVAAAVVLIAVIGRSPDIEQPAPPAKPRVTLRQHFEVFRRPRTPADKLPSDVDTLGLLKLRPGRSRLVAKQGRYEVYLVPTRGGEVCIADYTRGLPEGAICSSVADMADETNPLGQFGPDWLTYVLPNGVHDIRVVLADGTVVRPRLRDNAILVRVPEAPYSVTWVGAAGELHGIVLDRVAVGTPDCRSLNPLPPNATALASNAAIVAARVLHPGVSGVRVASVKDVRAPGCGRAVLLVQLSTGERVFVGSAHARMAVWPERTAAG
jgi:hypothetical protein